MLKVPQIEQHEPAERIAEKRAAFWGSFWRAIGLIAVLAAVIYAIPSLHEPPWSPVPEPNGEAARTSAEKAAEWIEFASITSIGLLLLAAGLFHFRGYRLAFEVHVETYGAMKQIFGEASRRLRRERNQPTDLTPPPRTARYNAREEMQAVLRELGADALGENSDWAATHHSRPLEPPLG